MSDKIIETADSIRKSFSPIQTDAMLIDLVDECSSIEQLKAVIKALIACHGAVLDSHNEAIL